jgi:hypothetical protein
MMMILLVRISRWIGVVVLSLLLVRLGAILVSVLFWSAQVHTEVLKGVDEESLAGTGCLMCFPASFCGEFAVLE